MYVAASTVHTQNDYLNPTEYAPSVNEQLSTQEACIIVVQLLLYKFHGLKRGA